MLKQLESLYRESWHYARACPLLFLVPVAAETAQHVAEYATGFYADIAHARAAETSPLRLALGVLLAGYWMTRWLAWRDAARVGALDSVAERRFAPLLALEMLVQMLGLWSIYGAHGTPPLGIVIAAVLGPFLLALLLADWQARAPLGLASGPLGSARLVLPVLPWALAFNLLAFLPVMIVHYALGYGAIAGSTAIKWPLLAADTLLVGYLSAILAGVPWYIAVHARAARDTRT